MRKLIYVASPLKGDYEGNMEKAREYCRYVMSKGHIPFAPHLLFTLAGITDEELKTLLNMPF